MTLRFVLLSLFLCFTSIAAHAECEATPAEYLKDYPSDVLAKREQIYMERCRKAPLVDVDDRRLRGRFSKAVDQAFFNKMLDRLYELAPQFDGKTLSVSLVLVVEPNGNISFVAPIDTSGNKVFDYAATTAMKAAKKHGICTLDGTPVRAFLMLKVDMTM